MPSCSICVEDLHKPSCCIPCGHVFCIDCIHDWKQRKEAHKDWNCPQCRKHIIDTQALYIDQEDDIDKCRPLQEKLDNLEDQLRVLQSTNEQLNDENNMYKRYKAEHDQLEDKVKDITKLLSSLQKTNNSLKKDTEKLQREKKSRKYHIANLQKTINSLEISLKCEKDSNWILSKEVSNVKQQLITVEMERKEAGDALNTLKQKTDSKTANSYCERFVKVFKDFSIPTSSNFVHILLDSPLKAEVVSRNIGVVLSSFYQLGSDGQNNRGGYRGRGYRGFRGRGFRGQEYRGYQVRGRRYWWQ